MEKDHKHTGVALEVVIVQYFIIQACSCSIARSQGIMADSHNDPDRGDPGHRRTHDPDLQKAKEDTAQVFIEYARLSASAVERDQSSPTESDLTKQCLQLVHDGNSRNGAAVVGPSTLPRQKSSETATRKDPHPKAVYSTRQPAQIVSNPHCGVGEPSTHHTVSPGSTSTRSNRPDKLSLSGRVLKRIPSATGSDNDSSGKTTPAQDPPMELMSPGTGVGELSASLPLPSSSSSTAGSDRINREWLIRSAGHATATATVAAASSSQASCTTTSQEQERRFPSVVSTMHATCVYWLHSLQFPGCNILYILVKLHAVA